MNLKLIQFISIIFLVFACNVEQDETVTNEKASADMICHTNDISGFNTYLGLKYGDGEELLRSKIGLISGGDFVEDSTSFVYHFRQVKNMPLSIWADVKTGIIEAIFIEVLSKSEEIGLTIQKAEHLYGFDSCDLNLFGLTEVEMVKRLGEPASRLVDEHDVVTLSYSTNDIKTTTTFKFYPEQDLKCSSILINWFY